LDSLEAALVVPEVETAPVALAIDDLVDVFVTALPLLGVGTAITPSAFAQ
jgi:hypothetical protein